MHRRGLGEGKGKRGDRERAGGPERLEEGECVP